MIKSIIAIFFIGIAAIPAFSQTASVSKIPVEVEKILNKNACLACHQIDKKVVGPPYIAVAKKNYTIDQMVALIQEPRPTNWPGYPPMAPMKHVPKEDLIKVASWINTLAPKKSK